MFKLSWAEAHRLPWKPANPLDPLELHETVSKWLVYIKVGLTWWGSRARQGKRTGSDVRVWGVRGGAGVASHHVDL